MKNLFLLFAAFLCSSTALMAQIPDGNEGINYQAVARDGAGVILSDADLTVTISIYSGALADALEYSETHDVTTNTYGMFNLVIGEGTPAGAEIYDDVRFKDDQHWMEVAILEIGTGTLTTLPKQSFQSVPYAHISNCADTANYAFSSSVAIIVLNDSVNNLDQAYDKGGPGAGRMIAVDAGPVELTGTMDSNVLEVWQFSDDEDALVVESIGDGHAVAIGNAGGSSITIDDTAETGDNVIDVTSSGDGDVINIWSTGDGDVIEIDSDGTGDGMYMLNSGGHAIQILDDSDTTDFYLLSTGDHHGFDVDKLAGGSTLIIDHHTDSSAIHVRNESIVSGPYVESNERNRAGYFENASAINNRPALEGNNRDEDGVGVVGLSGDRSTNFNMYGGAGKTGVAGLTRTDNGKGVYGAGLEGTGVLGHTGYKLNDWDGSLAPSFRAGVIGEVIDTVTTSGNEVVLGFGVIGSTSFGTGVLGYTGNDHGVIGITNGLASGHTQAGIWAMTQDGGWTQHRTDYKYRDDVHSKEEVALLAQSKGGTGSWHESIAGIGLVATQGSSNSLDSLTQLIKCDPTGNPHATTPPVYSETDSLKRAALVVKSNGSTAYPAVVSSAAVTDKPTLLVESLSKRNSDFATAAVQIQNRGSASGLRIDNKPATDPDTNTPATSEALRITHERDGIGLKLDMKNEDATNSFIVANSNAAGGSTAVFENGPHTNDEATVNNYLQNTSPVLKAAARGAGSAAKFESLMDTTTAPTLHAIGRSKNTVAYFENTSLDEPVLHVLQEGMGAGAIIESKATESLDTTLGVFSDGKGYSLLVEGNHAFQDSMAVFRYKGNPDLSGYSGPILPTTWEEVEALVDYVANDLGDKNGRTAAFIQHVESAANQISAEECVLIESNVGSLFSVPDPVPGTPQSRWTFVNPAISWNKWLDPHFALKVNSYNAAQFNGNVQINQGLEAGYVEIPPPSPIAPPPAFGDDPPPAALMTEPKRWSFANFGTKEGPASYFEITPDDMQTKDVPAVVSINYAEGAGGLFAVGDSLTVEESELGTIALAACYKKPDPSEGSDPSLNGEILNSAYLGVEDGPAGSFITTAYSPLDEPTIESINFNDGHAGLFSVGDTLSDDWAKLYPTSIASFYKKDDVKPYWNRALLNMKDGPAAHFDMTEEMGNVTPTLVSQNQSGGPAGAFILGDSLLTSDYAPGPPSAVFSAFKTAEPGSVDPLATKDVFNVAKLNVAGGSAAYLDVTPASYPKPVPTAMIQNRAEGHAAYLMVGDSIRDVDFAMDTAAALVASWQKTPTGSVDPLDPAVSFSKTILNQKEGPAGYFEIPPNEMVAIPAIHGQNLSGGLGGFFTVGMPTMDYSPGPSTLSAGLMAGMRVSEVPDSAFHNKAVLGVEGGPAAFFEISGGMEEDPMKMSPTVEIKNAAKGHAGLFYSADSSNVMSTVLVDAYSSGNALEVRSSWGDAGTTLNVYRDEPSADGDPTTGKAASFSLEAPGTDADCVVEITSSATDPDHAALIVTPFATSATAAEFEGKVEVGGDMEFGTGATITMGPGSSFIAGGGGLVDVTTIDAGTIGTDDLVVSFDAFVLGGLDVGGSADIGGSLDVVGSLSKGSGTFKIDHPLDPYNKYLYHSFVESPDMMNIYNGNITTDEEGYATVEMPEYFEALNMDFRYQLTVIGAFAQAIVLEEIEGNQFRIQTDNPNVKVSWQVTGVRQDTYAKQNRVQVEVDKEPENVGTLLYEPVLEK